uniref:Uncharacterized protein n=1 Tax=Vespula pensylvanica TaxID=30213 RepID=A0A834NYT7_VESPE|nr:hypothetical protein H0235_009480 [Vespula pensylvanica]
MLNKYNKANVCGIVLSNHNAKSTIVTPEFRLIRRKRVSQRNITSGIGISSYFETRNTVEEFIYYRRYEYKQFCNRYSGRVSKNPDIALHNFIEDISKVYSSVGGWINVLGFASYYLEELLQIARFGTFKRQREMISLLSN